MKKTPFVSILICTFNGSKKIEKCLRSLINQNYPKNKFELIIVDDGSTDNTIEVVLKFPVVLVKHQKNKGIATARNTGLMKSHGEIIVNIDDDCVMDKNWLKNLIKAYDTESVMGAGGVLILPNNPSIVDEYCYHVGYGNPTPILLGKSNNIVERFWNYLHVNFTNPQSKYINGSLVFEFPTINSSFRKKYLTRINGWNELFTTSSEDLDICRRLKNRYPKLDFVVMPKAKLIHKQDLTLLKFLSKEYNRGKLRKKYYTIKNQIPPYFPFPILFILISIIIVLLKLSVIIILFIPFLLYPWWIIRAFNQKRVKILLFPYLQLLHEEATVLGMLIN